MVVQTTKSRFVEVLTILKKERRKERKRKGRKRERERKKRNISGETHNPIDMGISHVRRIITQLVSFLT